MVLFVIILSHTRSIGIPTTAYYNVIPESSARDNTDDDDRDDNYNGNNGGTS